MSTPAIIWIVLISLGMGVEITNHGKPRTGKYSAGGRLLAVAISAGLLYWGGFFNVVH